MALDDAEQVFRSIVGSFNWLAMATRPDIATITHLLSHHWHATLPGHIAAAKHVLRYLIGSIDLGIEFSPLSSSKADAFVNFPLDKHKVTALTNAN